MSPLNPVPEQCPRSTLPWDSQRLMGALGAGKTEAKGRGGKTGWARGRTATLPGRPGNILQMELLKQQMLISRVLEVKLKIRVRAEEASSEVSLPGRMVAALSLCPHLAISGHDHVSFYKNSGHTG